MEPYEPFDPNTMILLEQPGCSDFWAAYSPVIKTWYELIPQQNPIPQIRLPEWTDVPDSCSTQISIMEILLSRV